MFKYGYIYIGCIIHHFNLNTKHVSTAASDSAPTTPSPPPVPKQHEIYAFPTLLHACSFE